MYDWSTYPLPTGTTTIHGVIDSVSYTGYMIDGEWFAHTAIHGPRKWAEPLVVLS